MLRVEAHERVGREERHLDGVEQGAQDAVASADGVERQIGVIALLLEVVEGAAFGLGVCADDEPAWSLPLGVRAGSRRARACWCVATHSFTDASSGMTSVEALADGGEEVGGPFVSDRDAVLGGPAAQGVGGDPLGDAEGIVGVAAAEVVGDLRPRGWRVRSTGRAGGSWGVLDGLRVAEGGELLGHGADRVERATPDGRQDFADDVAAGAQASICSLRELTGLTPSAGAYLRSE